VPESGIDINITERQHANGDGASLIVTYSNKAAIILKHPYHITFGNTIIGTLDSARKHPGMETKETILLAPFELQVLHIS
jgi:hypothetical protein